MAEKKAGDGSGARPFGYRRGQLCCGTVELAGLAEKFGTPLYVYSGDEIRARFGMFREAFARRAHTICYAVKANSSLSVLRLLAHEGAGFDIVSGGGTGAGSPGE